MRSGSERMHTWRRTPSTGPNFQTLIIWITVLKRQVVMVQFLSINFFLGFLQFLLGFSKVPVFSCHSVLVSNRESYYRLLTTKHILKPVGNCNFSNFNTCT